MYDKSPLNVVMKTHTPGDDGHWYPVEYSYGFNAEDEGIKKFQFEEENDGVWFHGSYNSGELSVVRSQKYSPTIVAPINTEYKDSEGRLVAKRVKYDDNDIRTTYYVYDELGRQRYVIPHIQADQMQADRDYVYRDLQAYCYYTEYDQYGNSVRQCVPGMDEVISVYDNRGRLVLSQSGNLRSTGQWSFTKYDELDRPIMTGVVSGGTYEEHVQAVQSQAIFGETRGDAIHGYTNSCYPTNITANDVLTVSYYDDYDWMSNAEYEFSIADSFERRKSSDIVAMATGTKTKVLGVSDNIWLTSVVYYDDKCNLIQNVKDLYPSGKEIVSNSYNWNGNIVQTKVKQTSAAGIYEYNKWFDYDSQGRLLSVRQRITDDPRGEIVLASYQYDDLNQMISKTVHDGLDKTDYEFSV